MVTVTEARRVLVQRAKRAARVMELDPHVWARGVRAELPEHVAAIGHDNFQHLVRWAWSLP